MFTLCDDEWITPIKYEGTFVRRYEILKMKT